MKLYLTILSLISILSIFSIYQLQSENLDSLTQIFNEIKNDDDGENYYNIRLYSSYYDQYLTRSLEDSPHDYSFNLAMEAYDVYNFDQIFNSTIAYNNNRYVSQNLYVNKQGMYYNFYLNYFVGDDFSQLTQGGGAALTIFKNKEVEGEFFLYSEKFRKWFCGNLALDRNSTDKCTWKIEYA